MWLPGYKQRIRDFLCFLVCTILCTCCSGCQNQIPTSQTEKISVVTTIFPAFDFAREIAGEYADVSMLLHPGTESHSYEPSPADIIAVENCDIFIYNGGESDAWVETMLENIDTSDCIVLPMMESVELMEEEHTEGDSHHHHEDGHTAEYDEHIWTSPKNAVKIVGNIREALMKVDPGHREYYQDRFSNYSAKLRELDKEFEEIVATGKLQTIVFGDRFPFRYFAETYGLKYRAAFPGCSAETEPSAKTVAYLIDKIKQEGIPNIFYIEFSNQRLAKVIQEETGAEPLLFHSCHNVSKEEMESGYTYLSLMWENARNLKEALQSETHGM